MVLEDPHVLPQPLLSRIDQGILLVVHGDWKRQQQQKAVSCMTMTEPLLVWSDISLDLSSVLF
jgi:hypothetical protein